MTRGVGTVAPGQRVGEFRGVEPEQHGVPDKPLERVGRHRQPSAPAVVGPFLHT